MTGKRKYNLTIIGFLIVLLVMMGALLTYANADKAPDAQVLVWFFITVGALAGAFTFGNAVEHYTAGLTGKGGVNKKAVDKVVDSG